MLLRPTQDKALALVQDAYRSGKRRPLLCAHTAFGKSTLTSYMLTRTKKSVLFLVHRDGLLERISADLDAAGIRHGVISGARGALPNTYNVHIGMMNTIARRLDQLPQFEWVISDEAHLAAGNQWSAILQHFRSSWHLGMSATPCRLDGKGLGTLYDEIVYGPSIKESIDRGYLVPARVFAPPNEVGATHKMSLTSASALLDVPTITGSAIAEMRKRAPDRQALAFCTTRQHAESVAQQFRNDGISSIAVDSTMADRKERIRDFEAGRVQVLTNVELLTTGWDYPPVSLGIFLRDTDSLALYLQMCGRFVRTCSGKSDWIMQDHVGVVTRHGMPDADREWTLDGRVKRSAASPVRQCPQCYAVFEPAPKCPSCGYVILAAAKPRQTATQRSGELEEVTGLAAADRQADVKAVLKGCRSLADFQAVAQRFGYKSGWAFKMHEIYGRFRRRAA